MSLLDFLKFPGQIITQLIILYIIKKTRTLIPNGKNALVLNNYKHKPLKLV